MVGQHPSNSADDACYVIGRWDESINPAYDGSSKPESFVFKYDNGATDCGFPARTWAPTFVCDMSTEYSLGPVTELAGSCYYNMGIDIFTGTGIFTIFRSCT